MPELLDSFLRLLQGSALGQTVRGSAYVYPVLESVHILGIGLLIGPAFTFDMRLTGVGHRILSVTTAARNLLLQFLYFFPLMQELLKLLKHQEFFYFVF
jgi:hypothetical protein